jgi:adenylate cyclase
VPVRGGQPWPGRVDERPLTGEALKADLRFAELVSEFLGATRQVRKLEHKQAHLTQFFSPTVLQTFDSESVEDELAPREMDITVLFCDVRGFSRKSEDSQNDLHALLKRVSEALGVMTRCIVKHGGIIADFQGDAALGFWGWPRPPEDGPLAACRTALEIQSEFRRAAKDPGHALAGFQVGIGVAHGRAIAGKIGTTEQAKVGVFGPVVNLGSRLEWLTKQLRASILLDEHTAEYARMRMDRKEGRTRKLGTVRPYGMKTALTVSELIQSASAADALTDEQLAAFEAAVDAIKDREWPKALELLDSVPYTDRTKDFLMIYIAQNAYEPPENWDGVIQMQMK